MTVTEPPSDQDALAPILTYEQARELASHADEAIRVALAGRTDVAPEILYFLCQDGAASVRMTVAANPAAPVKADLRLSDDGDEAVREALAIKVADAERSGGRGKTRRQKMIGQQVLDQLSRDRLTAVRSAIAEGLKSLPGVDRDIIKRLAQDLEILVAAPILEHSPVLLDEDLLDIIRSSPVQGALAAISRRSYVDPSVTEAIVASNDSHAITHLLYNANAHLREHTLDSLIESAGDKPDWQPPLIHRPELAESSVRRLAEVVAENLLDRLMEREDLGEDTVSDLREVVRARLRERYGDGDHAARSFHPVGGESLPSPYDHETDHRYEAALAEAQAQHAKGRLTEAAVTISLLTDHTDGLVAGLSVLSGLGVRVIVDILASQSARAIASLAWAADLSPRFALELQLKMGRISSERAIRPAPTGGHGLEEAEMRWQIEMYADG